MRSGKAGRSRYVEGEAMVERWWQEKPGVRYWLETTDREDIGVDLRAPDTDASGRDNWRYTLLRETTPAKLYFTTTAARARS
jgi:hypothetical protein